MIQHIPNNAECTKWVQAAVNYIKLIENFGEKEEADTRSNNLTNDLLCRIAKAKGLILAYVSTNQHHWAVRVLYPNPFCMDMGTDSIFTTGLIAAGLQHHAGQLSDQRHPEYERHKEERRDAQLPQQRGDDFTWRQAPAQKKQKQWKHASKGKKRGSKAKQSEEDCNALTAKESSAMRLVSQLCHYCFDWLEGRSKQVDDISDEHLTLIAITAAKDLEQLNRHAATIDLPFRLRCQLYMMTSTYIPHQELVPLVCWASSLLPSPLGSSTASLKSRQEEMFQFEVRLPIISPIQDIKYVANEIVMRQFRAIRSPRGATWGTVFKIVQAQKVARLAQDKQDKTQSHSKEQQAPEEYWPTMKDLAPSYSLEEQASIPSVPNPGFFQEPQGKGKGGKGEVSILPK